MRAGGTHVVSAGQPGGKQVALVDELPLRRASTLHLLRLHLREPVTGVADADALVARARALQGRLSCILLTVGGSSLVGGAAPAQARQLHTAFPGVPLAILSDRETVAEVAAAFRLGARGLIPTSLDPEVAVGALRLIRAGGAFFPAGALRRGGHGIAQPQPAAPVPPGCERWPPRQRAVLGLLAQGKANKEIARSLGMEESTVKVHVWHIMRKLGATNRTQAALRAAELGILAPDPGREGGQAAPARAMVA